MKVVRNLALIVVMVGVLGACSGGGDDDSSPAGDAAKRQMEFVVDRLFDRQYDELHPAQQAQLTKDAYLDCATNTFGNLPSDTTVSVKETSNEKLDVPLSDIKGQDAVSVTLVLKSGTETQEITIPEFLVDGQYRFTLGQGTMEHCFDPDA